MTSFTITAHIPTDAPAEYKQHRYEALRHEAGNKILEILCGMQLPAVVDVEEVVKQETDGCFQNDVLEVHLSITPVRHRDVEMAFVHFPKAVDEQRFWSKFWNKLICLVRRK